MRLVHDPVGQAIIFELLIRLFYLFVLGVRPDCVAQPRGPKGTRSPLEWCTDGVASSVVVQGAYGPLLAVRGEVEVGGRGSPHPHIEAWAVCQQLREKLLELMADPGTLKSRLRKWIREWINAVNSIHHSSVANLPKLFGDGNERGELPTVTTDILARTRMDGGEDRLPGFLPKQRARVLPEDVLPAHDLGPDDPYLREGDRPSPADAEAAFRAPAEAKVRVRKIILKGNVCSSFPAYRRQKSLVAQRRQKTTEMSA